MEKNYAKKQRGITLIALVVTIVILLILSGISLNIVLGNNGIITKAQEAKIENNHSTVLEMLQMESSNYDTKYLDEEDSISLISYLKQKQIIDSNLEVNVEKLLGKKLSTGNGSGVDDVYVIEENVEDNSYELVYKKSKKTDKNLGLIGYEKDGVDEPSDPSIFDFDPETGTISLKGAVCMYWFERYDDNSQITRLKKIVVPEEIDGVKVTTIGYMKQIMSNAHGGIAFADPYVEKIVLPNTIVKIGQDAFAGCSNLKSINIPDSVTSIGAHAFYNCNSLKSIEIPDSVTTDIEEKTFLGCSSMENIRLPNTIREFGYYAFSGCKSLKKINIPTNLYSLRDCSLDTCESLEEITVNGEGNYYTSEDGVLFNKAKTVLVVFPQGSNKISYTIPANTEYIDRNGLSSCIGLQEINVENENINYTSEDGILYNKDKTSLCSYPAGKKQNTYNVPETVTSISANFSKCQYLNYITIPKNVQSIGGYYPEKCFYCTSLKEINVDSNNTKFCSEEGVLFNKDKTKLICYPASKESEEYSIPEGTTEVASLAKCKNLKRLTISSTVSYISNTQGIMDLNECESLEEITVNSGNTNFYSENGVLFSLNSSGKKELECYPAGKKESSYVIPDGVTGIVGSLAHCRNLKDLTIPSSVTNLYYSTFDGCKDLHVIVKKGSQLTMNDFTSYGMDKSQITFE